MSEIVFEDILTHYSLKLQQAFDEIDIIKSLSKRLSSLADESWQGDAANAFQDKLNEMNTRLDETNTELAEAMKSLSTIQKSL